MSAEDLKEKLPVGPDPDRYVEQIRELENVGYTHVYLRQVGGDQDGFFRFWTDELSKRV